MRYPIERFADLATPFLSLLKSSGSKIPESLILAQDGSDADPQTIVQTGAGQAAHTAVVQTAELVQTVVAQTGQNAPPVANLYVAHTAVDQTVVGSAEGVQTGQDAPQVANIALVQTVAAQRFQDASGLNQDISQESLNLVLDMEVDDSSAAQAVNILESIEDIVVAGPSGKHNS